MGILTPALRVIREHRKAYIAINIGYYGIVLLFMVLVAGHQGLQRSLIGSVGVGFSSAGPLGFLGQAYQSGQVGLAALYTFVLNLFAGSLLYITVPSLVVPFAGLLAGAIRAALWGLLLSPAMPELRLAMIPHSLTMLLEGQGYVLAVLGSYALWMTAFRGGPQSGGFLSRYWAGIRKSLHLYLVVIIMLAAAAIYEAVEVIYLVPRLVG